MSQYAIGNERWTRHNQHRTSNILHRTYPHVKHRKAYFIFVI
jgi:hypothetical protein